MTIKFKVNNKPILVGDDKQDMPLLWFIREELNLKGTKFGCGVGQCGACTVHFNGKAVRSCVIPVSGLQGMEITTIEGLSEDGSLHLVQQAWMNLNVPQCGYCQPGQIMSAAALLNENPQPSEQEIENHMTNLCRCGTYTRIRKAVKQAAEAKAISTGKA